MTSSADIPSLAADFDAAVCEWGDQIAFRNATSTLTYAQLAAQIAQKSVAYDAAGIGATSAIGVRADDTAQFLSDVFALLQLQAFVLLLPADMTRWEFDGLSAHVRLSHLICDTPLTRGRTTHLLGRELMQFDGEPTAPGTGGRVGFITSGTTGHSKIALRTERAMLSEAHAMRSAMALTPGRRLAAMVPLHHSFGFGDCALSGLLAGVEVHSYPRQPPSAYLSTFAAARIDVVALVPPQLRLLAEACRAPDFAALAVLSAGAPLDAYTAAFASERLGCLVGQVYGTTETGVIATAPPCRGGTTLVGTPSSHMQVHLAPLPEGWLRTEGAGQIEGIVSVSSAALFEGYVRPSGVDNEAVRDGWFTTGDRARWRNHQLELLGRLSSAINVAGVKVSAEEVEAAVLQFPAVRSVLVTGVEDAMACQRIKACVTPADVDLEALRRFCEERLSPAKRPSYYEAVTALATTPSGKVIRTARRQSA